MDLRSAGNGSSGWVLAFFAAASGCGSDQVAQGAYGAPDGSSEGASASSSGGEDGAAASSSGGQGGSSGSGGSSGQGGSSGAEGGVSAEAGTPTSPSCDMNGRWLVAQRVL